MQIRLTLSNPGEAERLRTAVYRFAEKERSLGAPPLADIVADGADLVGLVAFDNAAEGQAFAGYWRRFRNETMDWGGFRDV